MATAPKEKTPEDLAKSASALYQSWMKEIDSARKREKDFRKDAARIVKLYEAQDKDRSPFAILYSNTETLFPALYNNVPEPRVERRFRDEDPLGKAAAQVSTRSLKFLIEAESADYDSFDELIQPAVLGGLITNRGLTRFRYDAKISEGRVAHECVYGEDVRYDKFLHGYARTWKKVPWCAYEWDMDQAEWKANFPDKTVDFTSLPEAEEDPADGVQKKEDLTDVKLARVYEVWCKTSRKIMFFSPAWPKGPLKSIDDPLNLAGFFPTPKPLNFMRKISTLVPTPLYVQYESQAKELNDITLRLKNLIKAAKMRGFYNSTVEGIEKVLDAEDNELIPVENMASMPEGMGVDKMIWLIPLDMIVTAIQLLYQQREACKQVIYEITGVSDILRGATQASETATAQNIKNQWGTLRLKKMQKEVQRYCRDALRIILEIAATKFSPETFKAMTGLPYPMAAEKQQAQQLVAASQQQAQMMAQQAQMTGQQPPPAPPIPPEVQAILSSPSWEEVLGLLKDDLIRSYRVDIETNSTIDAEATQDKQDIAELLNSISQFLNGVAPLVENGSMPFDVAKAILLAISRRFTFGSELEDALNKMKPPEPKADPAAEAKAQSEQTRAQVEQMKAKAEMDRLQMEAQIAQQTFQQEQAMAAMELQIKQAELGLKQQELELKRQELAMKSEAATASHKMKMEASEHQHKMKMKEPKNAAV